MGVANYLSKILKGEHITKRFWKYTLLLAGLFLVMVYSSVWMDQKVYLQRKLKDELASQMTQYVELQTDVAKIQMESTLLEMFSQQGLVPTEEPFKIIRVK